MLLRPTVKGLFKVRQPAKKLYLLSLSVFALALVDSPSVLCVYLAKLSLMIIMQLFKLVLEPTNGKQISGGSQCFGWQTKRMTLHLLYLHQFECGFSQTGGDKLLSSCLEINATTLGHLANK